MSRQVDSGELHGRKSVHVAYRSRTAPPAYIGMVLLYGREPGDVFEDTGIKYDRADHIPFDFDDMPDNVKNDLAASAWKAIQRFMQRPNARAILDATLESLISEGSTLLDPGPASRARRT